MSKARTPAPYRPRLIALALSLAAAAFSCAAWPMGARAARLATPAEAKTLRAAFLGSPGHRHLVITNIEVARSNWTWARVSFLRPLSSSPKGARTARVKVIYVNYRQSGSRHHPREQPTKAKPPPKVEKDLDADIWVKVSYSGTASEHANASHQFSGNCGGPGDDFTGNTSWQADAQWDWHFTELVDVSITDADFVAAFGRVRAAATYRSSPAPPTYGDGSEQLTYNDDYAGPGAAPGGSDCVSNTDFTSTSTVHLSQSSYSAKYPIKSVPGIGITLLIPAELGRRVTSDGDPHNNELTAVGGPRLDLNAEDPYVGIPFLDANDPRTYDYLDSYHFTFTHNSLGEREPTVHAGASDGYCEFAVGQCSDTVDYSGTVTIEPK